MTTQNGSTKIFAPFRCVASFADGSRLAFDGMTREQARSAMEAAMEEHGDLGGWDWVTDENYIEGTYYKLIPPPPRWPFPVFDLTDGEDEAEDDDPGNKNDPGGFVQESFDFGGEP